MTVSTGLAKDNEDRRVAQVLLDNCHLQISRNECASCCGLLSGPTVRSVGLKQLNQSLRSVAKMQHYGLYHSVFTGHLERS